MLDLPHVLTSRMAFLLRLAMLRAEEMGEEALHDVEVDGREYGILELLGHRSPSTQIALGRQLGLDRTTCAAVLARLDQRGLVQRTPDPSNRRANLVTLTGTGERLRDQASRALGACDERFQATLTRDERAAMRRMLRLLAGLDEPV